MQDTRVRHVYIMRGLPGSGKSTVAEDMAGELTKMPIGDFVILRDTGPTEIISTDDFFVTDEGVYEFDPSKIGLAHANAFRRYIEFLTEPQIQATFLIIDNTNISVAEIAPYALAADAFGVPWSIVQVEVDPEVAFKRQTHGVPRPIFLRMAEAFDTEEFPPWWVEKVERVEG